MTYSVPPNYLWWDEIVLKGTNFQCIDPAQVFNGDTAAGYSRTKVMRMLVKRGYEHMLVFPTGQFGFELNNLFYEMRNIPLEQNYTVVYDTLKYCIFCQLDIDAIKIKMLLS